MFKKRFSRTAKREFAEKMDTVQSYCDNNSISYSSSMDSFYFSFNGLKYRISNHTIAKSNAGAFDEYGNQIREKYHNSDNEMICIFAGKTRLIEIHQKIINGIKIDKRGN